MKTRLELSDTLKEITGLNNLYFQPPETVRMKYPCIVYRLNDIDVKHADNNSYVCNKNYTVTVIDKDPDSEYPDKMLKLLYCSFDRFYTADNLNHWVFSLFF